MIKNSSWSFCAAIPTAFAMTPIVRMIDPMNNIPVFVNIVTAIDLNISNSQTYFLTSNCTGTAYHKIKVEFGVPAITGFRHSIARRWVLGNQELFATAVDGGVHVNFYNSVYRNMNCFEESGNSSLTQALSVLDIDAAHPPPYVGTTN